MRGATTSKLLKAFQTSRTIPLHLSTSSSTKRSLSTSRKLSPIPIYIASAVGLLSVGTYVHFHDEYFPYYPFPFAIDVGNGPSMLPTMIPGHVYLRDCWSDRFLWWNWKHFIQTSKHMFDSSISEHDAVSMTYRRPWQRGDIVVIFNGKYLACKRVVGLEGDTIQVYGQYAHTYHHLGNEDYGVPSDDRYPTPFCEKEALKQHSQANELSQTTIIVPAHHIWVEGDNPLCSIDSRHFGPVPISNLRGRVALKLWPIQRNSISNDSTSFNKRTANINREVCSCAVSVERPTPFMSIDEMLQNFPDTRNGN